MVEFVGRSHQVQTLHQLLQQNERVAITAIAGMGGVGKTELAIQYAKAHVETYQGGICWLLVKSGDIGTQVVRFARSRLDLNPLDNLDLLGQVEYCWQHWHEGEVLVVLDDVTEFKHVKPYLPPQSSRFKVLVTTRSLLGSSIAQLSLDVLQPEAALELLRSLIGAERLQQELDVAKHLCEWLDYLPLGLELVGRYLARKKDLPLAEMWGRLQAKRLEERSLNKPKSEDDMTAQLGVADAFELSWQELEDAHKHLGCLLSLFASAPILWRLVEQCLLDQAPEDLEVIRDDILLNLHLLQRKSEGTYQLHQLIREFFLKKLKGLAQVDDLKQAFAAAMVAVARKIPEFPTHELITAVTPAMPHVAEVANNLTEYLSDEDLPWCFIGLGRFYKGQGFYEQAALWHEQCLSITQDRFGSDHPDVFASLNNVAYIYCEQGCNSKAEPLYIEALQLRQRLLGNYHPDVAQSLNNLALLYYEQGRYSEAEPLYIEALEIWERLSKNDHPHLSVSLNNLALLYCAQGRYSEAEPLYRKALNLFKRLLGKEHPNIATNLHNLADLYKSQGRYQEAEVLFMQALELSQRLLGEEHPNVAQIFNNLALLYHIQGRYQEAEPLFVQALKICEQRLGINHPLTVTIHKNLESQRNYLASEQ